MVEVSVPDGLPQAAVARLVALRQELEEGYITDKGYRKHRDQVLLQYGALTSGSSGSMPATDAVTHSRRPSGFESIMSYQTSDSHGGIPGEGETRLEFGLDGRPLVDWAELGELQDPLPPRGIPETANTDPLNVKVRLNTFDNLPSILRHRGRTNGDIIAFQCLDDRGKETSSITWGKLSSRSEKVAQMLRDGSGLFRGDRVVLVYANYEPIDFVVALMGCFLAGLVAVPVSPEHASAFLAPVLKTAQSKLVLMSEHLHKRVSRTAPYAQLATTTTFWKTTDWGSFKGTIPPLQVPDLAYIEFLRGSNGDLRGVVMSHRTILHEMRCLTALTQSREGGGRGSTDRVLCSLDVRRSTGMILGILLTVYAGNQVYFLSPSAMATPGLYAHLASRLRTTILLSDYSALKGVCYNYQREPAATRKFAKRHDPSLAHVRWCLVDVPTVDPEFMVVLTDRWLKPLGHKNPHAVVAPMLTLTEHGGMVVATKDFLTPGGGSSEVQISREALERNRIEYTSSEDALRVCSFGYPIPDATVAIVDPETNILSPRQVVGEIWIDSPSLSGGFWANADDTERTFHARCYGPQGELPMEFLRTGLLGFVKGGKVYVLGTRADRVLQVSNQGPPRYYYSHQLLETLMKSVSEIYDGCVFQVTLNQRPQSDEGTNLLNVVLLESPKAPQQPRRANSLLDEMAAQVITVLREVHKFRVCVVLLAPPNSAPRTIRSGKPDIAKVAARRQYLRGQLIASHIKFDLDNAGLTFASGDDVKGGIWGRAISQVRTNQLESAGNDKQYSGVDMRQNVLDDRMATSLDSFKSLVELLQWRLQRQPDELAYLSVGLSNMTKETSWRQLGSRVGAVYHYITNHLRARANDVACLIYTHSEDYVVTVLACFLAGIVVIPISPINLERIAEDVGTLQKVIRQFKVTLLLGNTETHGMMEDKQLQSYLKSRQLKLPKLHNTSKARFTEDAKQVVAIKPPPTGPTRTSLIWLYFTADHDYEASYFTQQQILGMCKIQKETCQMSATKPIIGCVRSVSGLGFLYTCCLGVYMGSFTILISPVDFAQNPAVYFVTNSRYKVKDGYGTPQMLRHATKQLQRPRGFDLSDLQNLVIPLTGRADLDLVGQMRLTFASVGLESVTVNLAYGPVCNPMVTTRSYMLVENIDLWLDPVALRQGLVSVVNPNNAPNALHLVDSGMVPINTQVAIVNPETLRLCRVGEVGEIWVVSEGNQIAEASQSHSGVLPIVSAEIADGAAGIKYMRTGDLGFLHTVTKGPNLEMQVLFVCGSLRTTLDINGLQHFAEDIELTMTSSHTQVADSVIAMCGGILCAIIETPLNAKYLPSLAAVISNAVISEHEFALNVISFIPKGSMPRSRLGEKQRKTLLQLYTGSRKPEPGSTFRTVLDFTVKPVDF